MSQTFDLLTTNLRGAIAGSPFQGTPFSDSPPSGDILSSIITKIGIRADRHVHSLQVHYSWDESAPAIHGVNTNGKFTTIAFDTGEYITRIDGIASEEVIVQLTFATNKQTYGPYGGKYGTPFTWGTTDMQGALPMKLLAFHGTADYFVRSLGASFSQPRPDPPRYEPKSVELAALNSGSSFSCYLTSTISTLLVGQEAVTFRAHEAVLCKLPFFQAALQGQFREAIEKRISLPEDDPPYVSALLEFLYTGNYTYTYDPRVAPIPQGSRTPPADLAEGLYHAGVSALASKYGAEELAARAIKNFGAVAHGLDSINALRLWKAVYMEGMLRLSSYSEEYGMRRDGEGLVAWVKELFAEHRAEMDETVMKCPQLAGDLLNILTGGVENVVLERRAR